MPEGLVFENTGDTKHHTALARSRVLPVLLLVTLSLVVVPSSSAGASPTVPGPPTAVSGTAGNGQVALGWTAPASDGGAAIMNYEVRVYNGAGVAAAGVSGGTTRAVGSAATSYSFGGLTNGTIYTFKVAAVNAAGTGPQSALSGPVDVGTPTAPTAVRAVSGYVGSPTGPLKVTFTPGANNGSAVTSFTATCTSTTGGVTGSMSASASPITVPELTRSETYTCTVKATNARGIGLASTPSAPVIVGSPGAPIEVNALLVASNQLKVDFTPGGNNGSEITSFTATCTSKNGGVTGTASRTSSPITVKALTPGRTYTCTVTATNSRGVGLPSTPTGPGAPTGVSATAGDASAVVSWSAPTGPNGGSPITGYDVTVMPGLRVVPVADPSARKVTVVALTPGTSYTFTVAARNEVGPGTKSAASAPVTPYVAVSIGDASVWEGTGFSVSASFAVTLSYPATQPLSVTYASAPGTASAGADYTAVSGTLSFSVGETTKVVTATVLGDSAVEPSETFTVTLSNPTNVRLGDAAGLGTIRDDDSWPGQSLAVSDATVHEGDNGSRTVQLAIRAKVDTFPVSVAYSAVRGSAEDADFVASPPQTLQLTSPNTLQTFTVKPDLLQEGDERFGIYISSPTIPVRDARGVATIVDNDLRVAPASPLFPTFTTSDVWTPPSPLPPGPPGDVIWSIPTPAPVPPYATTRTMLYRSRSALGEDVAISGWVTVPNGTPPAGGWPVLAWGHWTQGMDDSCAPTRKWDPTGIPYINDFVAAKYVVVAPDYEGLGTTGPTAYWAAEAYAHALLDGIRAARKLVPAASNRAVLFGGSEGGLAATAAAELWPYYAPEIDVRGAAGSGPGVASSLAETIAVRNAGGFVANSLAMVAGQNNAYPNAGIPSYYLTAAGIQELSAIQTVCSNEYATYPNTTGLFQPWLSGDPLVPPSMSATVASAADRDNLTSRAPAVPVLYVHGRNDQNFPPVFLPPFVERLCALGTTVELRWYQGGHMPFNASKSDVIAWIAARFAGSAAPTSCANIPHSENVAPTVSSIVRASSNPTNAASVAWTVTFSEAVTGVAPANFSLVATGPSGASITGITGTGTTRTVTASTGTGNGSLRLNLSNTSGIIDAAANRLSATFTGWVYTIDKIAPTVVSIAPAGSTPTNAAGVAWTVTFSQGVTGVAPANFSLAATGPSGGPSGASITGITGTGTTRTVTASTGTGNGDLGLDLSNPSGIIDAAGNQLSATFTGAAYTIDKTAPTVGPIDLADPTPTNAANVAWTVTFDEAVTGVAIPNFTLSGDGAGTASITGVAGAGTTWTVTASTGAPGTFLGLDLTDTSGVLDLAGNLLSNTFTGPQYEIVS